jgi:hypothetical protein
MSGRGDNNKQVDGAVGHSEEGVSSINRVAVNDNKQFFFEVRQNETSFQLERSKLELVSSQKYLHLLQPFAC